MKKLQDDSPLWQQIVKVAGFIIITGFVMYFAFFHQASEPKWHWSTLYPGVKEYSTDLYWRFHPLMWWDILGLILFELGLVAITGIWSIFLGVINVKKPDGYAWASWVLAVLGIILFMINKTSL